jgi:hypothetical protein
MERPDPNEDFSAAMRAAEAASGAEAEQESPEDDSAASALGAAVPPPPAPVEEEEEAAPAAEGSAEDDRLAKLEQQLAEAQSMIGRQANEIGELRRQPPASEPEDEYIESTGFVSQDSWETIEQTFEDKGGAGMMLNISHTNPELIDAALAYWKAQGDAEAFLYEMELQKTEAQLLKSAAPEPEQNEDVQTLLRRDAQRSAESQLLQEFGKERLEALTPQFKEGLDKLPQSVQTVLGQDLNSTDPERIVGAFRTVAALIPEANGELAQAAADQQAATKRAAKQAAAVNVGSQSGVAPGESAVPSTPEEMSQLDDETRRKVAAQVMRERILGNTTSVQAELAKNKAS